MSREEEIQARLDAATPGEWHWSGYRRVSAVDAKLIENAPADLRYLLDQLEALRQEQR